MEVEGYIFFIILFWELVQTFINVLYGEFCGFGTSTSKKKTFTHKTQLFAVN